MFLHQLHHNTYSYSDISADVEFVTLRAVHQKNSTEGSILEKINKFKKVKISKTFREVCFSVKDGFKKIPIYNRSSFYPGFTLNGPAVIEQSDTTTLIHKKHKLKVDNYNHLIIDVPSIK